MTDSLSSMGVPDLYGPPAASTRKRRSDLKLTPPASKRTSFNNVGGAHDISIGTPHFGDVSINEIEAELGLVWHLNMKDAQVPKELESRASSNATTDSTDRPARSVHISSREVNHEGQKSIESERREGSSALIRNRASPSTSTDQMKRSSSRTRKPTSKAQVLADTSNKFYRSLRETPDADIERAVVMPESTVTRVQDDSTHEAENRELETATEAPSLESNSTVFNSVEPGPARRSPRQRRSTAKASQSNLDSLGGQQRLGSKTPHRLVKSRRAGSAIPDIPSKLRHSIPSVEVNDDKMCDEVVPEILPLLARCMTSPERLFTFAKWAAAEPDSADESDDEEDLEILLAAADDEVMASRTIGFEITREYCECNTISLGEDHSCRRFDVDVTQDHASHKATQEQGLHPNTPSRESRHEALHKSELPNPRAKRVTLTGTGAANMLKADNLNKADSNAAVGSKKTKTNCAGKKRKESRRPATPQPKAKDTAVPRATGDSLAQRDNVPVEPTYSPFSWWERRPLFPMPIMSELKAGGSHDAKITAPLNGISNPVADNKTQRTPKSITISKKAEIHDEIPEKATTGTARLSKSDQILNGSPTANTIPPLGTTGSTKSSEDTQPYMVNSLEADRISSSSPYPTTTEGKATRSSNRVSTRKSTGTRRIYESPTEKRESPRTTKSISNKGSSNDPEVLKPSLKITLKFKGAAT